jgi:hypothetical protein
MNDTSKNENMKNKTTYTIEDAMKITDEIFKLNKEKNYNPGAFIHGLIFALELTQQSYNISQQQIAQIKRSCRKYFNEVKNYNSKNVIKD